MLIVVVSPFKGPRRSPRVTAHLCASRLQKSYAYQEHVFHYLVDSSLTFLCMAQVGHTCCLPQEYVPEDIRIRMTKGGGVVLVTCSVPAV